MTMIFALLIIWNPAKYTAPEIREAAAFILGTLGAHQEDIDQAYAVSIG